MKTSFRDDGDRIRMSNGPTKTINGMNRRRCKEEFQNVAHFFSEKIPDMFFCFFQLMIISMNIVLCKYFASNFRRKVFSHRY